jgi:CDP-diglyceride synthetase
MFCSIKSAAQRRFVRTCWMSGGLVAVLAVAAAAAFRLWHLKGLPAYPVAVLPALPILWVLIETGRYLAIEKDEFQRNLLVQCLLGGIGGTLAVTTVWGYMEDFARAPRLDLIWVYPIFWLFVGIAMPVVYRRYR